MSDEVKVKVLRDAILVAGHPRSGTSLACQLVESAGVDFPSDFAGDEYNKSGYYELEENKKLTKKLLEEAMTVKNTIKLNKIVDRLNECQGPAGLKLVRIPAIFFYRHITRNLRSVLVFRHPAEVKASLLRRGISRFEPAWFENNNALIAAHDNIEDSILIEYETILQGGEKVRKLFSTIGLEINTDVIDSRERTQQKSRMVLTAAEERLYSRLKEIEEQQF